MQPKHVIAILLLLFINMNFILFSGAKRDNNLMQYFIKFDDTLRPEKVQSADVIKYWPKQIIDFFEKRIEWIRKPDDDTDEWTNESDEVLDAYPQQILCNFDFNLYPFDLFVIF